MIIEERIRCRVYSYNYTSGAYVDVYGKVLDESSIISASVKRQCCPDGGFSIGGVYASTLSMQIHLPGMTAFRVRGAKLVVWSKYSAETDWYRLGTFWVTDASRAGEVFTLSAQDAVGWLDTSSLNDAENTSGVGHLLFQNHSGVGRSLESYGGAAGWTQALTSDTNQFIQCQTGIPNMLTWKRWNEYTETQNEHYCNSHIWSDQTQYEGWFELPDVNIVYANGGDDAIDSDAPRDLYRMLAEIMFGYIYAESDGALTLGQFGASHFGTAEIGMSEIEYDSCEIAEFELKMARAHVRAEYDEQETSAWTALSDRDYSKNAYFYVTVESNLFLDWMARGFSGARSLSTVARGMWNWFYGFTDGAGVTHAPLHIRPFSCTVHSGKRFMPGQRIKLTYRDFHESSTRVYDSLITSVTWTYRGGYQLSCGGEDNRVMADCMRGSKGDKVRKEARTRCRAIEKRITALGG